MKKNLVATLQRSYYGKAKTRRENDLIILTSYNTDVAMIDVKTNTFYRLWNGWSATTAKHVNEFRLQNGFTPLNKKAWLDLECVNAETVYNVVFSNGFYVHTCPALLTRFECENEIKRITENRPDLIIWYE